MLIDFSNLPIAVDTRLKQSLEQAFTDCRTASESTMITFYPELNNGERRSGYAARFEWPFPNTAMMTALVAFKPCNGFASVIGLCRNTKSLLMDTHYHLDGLSLTAFLTQWQMALVNDIHQKGVDQCHSCKILPLHWVLEDAENIGERRVTKMRYALRSIDHNIQ